MMRHAAMAAFDLDALDWTRTFHAGPAGADAVRRLKIAVVGPGGGSASLPPKRQVLLIGGDGPWHS